MSAPSTCKLEAAATANVGVMLNGLATDAFASATWLAAYVCDAPLAVLALSNKNRHWIANVTGRPRCALPIEVAFCASTVAGTEVDEVTDTLDDERFFDEALARVAGPVRYYVGAPLLSKTGTALGALCIMDSAPRKALGRGQRQALAHVARQTAARMEGPQAAMAGAAAAKGRDFGAEVTHSLRSPLATILGFTATMLRDEAMEPALRTEFLTIVQDETNRLAAMIETLLHDLGIDTGITTMRGRPVNGTAEGPGN